MRAQIRAVACWCNKDYTLAKWKDIEMTWENCKIQHLVGDKELFKTKQSLTDPMTKFTVVLRYRL